MNGGCGMAAEDRVLIIGLKRGDMPSFERIFEKYRRPVFAYVRGILNDESLAEDCVQDVFLELARKAESIDLKRGVKGWLFRVARNKAIDVLRKRSREVQSDQQDLRQDESATPEESAMSVERNAELKTAISELEEPEQEIVVMRFFGGLTFAEAEEATGIPLNTLIWRCRRALQKLSRKIEKI